MLETDLKASFVLQDIPVNYSQPLFFSHFRIGVCVSVYVHMCLCKGRKSTSCSCWFQRQAFSVSWNSLIWLGFRESSMSTSPPLRLQMCVFRPGLWRLEIRCCPCRPHFQFFGSGYLEDMRQSYFLDEWYSIIWTACFVYLFLFQVVSTFWLLRISFCQD